MATPSASSAITQPDLNRIQELASKGLSFEEVLAMMDWWEDELPPERLEQAQAAHRRGRVLGRARAKAALHEQVMQGNFSALRLLLKLLTDDPPRRPRKPTRAEIAAELRAADAETARPGADPGPDPAAAASAAPTAAAPPAAAASPRPASPHTLEAERIVHGPEIPLEIAHPIEVRALAAARAGG